MSDTDELLFSLDIEPGSSCVGYVVVVVVVVLVAVVDVVAAPTDDDANSGAVGTVAVGVGVVGAATVVVSLHAFATVEGTTVMR